jgi:hypothetical protein
MESYGEATIRLFTSLQYEKECYKLFPELQFREKRSGEI